MSKKVWVVRYYRPGKFEPKMLEWDTYKTEAEAKKAYEEAKKVEGATELSMFETEVCSL